MQPRGRRRFPTAPGGPIAGDTQTWPSSSTGTPCARRSRRPDIVFHLQDRSARSLTRAGVVDLSKPSDASSVNVLIGTTEVGCRRIVLTVP